ncbi:MULTISPECIES: pirin family protein [unclassified Brevundimonas]|uniref:pirin family protein n=1 Tax=unclassified Brevundimonas TaxID=2622653 RepID=UPI000CFC56DC|nr:MULTISPECIES: pirin family protein [unclassified Brevundimonas]PRA20850.1 quercetin 2,3-dioxygenase [Brevundimonas sp. MYb27]PQZ83364.1 quercetin 2,3-dioxygenase [Brevundimonas sp. MYb31]PRB14362.1 quercetin 2,3-dioxygenase [Brevundimonas sp. MYb52]PRB35393.1 quercetin 2,3-dioxygenase [Brevundimonas sp. MYb46]PRB40812.1 quercetin 2,3-dioxygenase [Brevundimonas sp. MYb33]
MKKVLGRYGNDRGHWVGDGFPVRSLFSYDSVGKQVSPFLLLDYAGPHNFEPTDKRRGVGQHPHRGFETVTIVYDGEVEHRDSTGQGGVIGPGDVQWMTAGGGILHEEFHSPAFARTGGPFRMVQLWVNLPAKDKMTRPGYQSILNADIPTVTLPDNAGTARIIAGAMDGSNGPASTFTPINVWDVRLNRDAETTLTLPEGHTAIVVVLSGHVTVNGDQGAGSAEALLLDRQGTSVTLHADADAVLLVLTGEPIDEPIVGYGPFVMNSEDEIRTAITDFNSGRFGDIPAA